MNLHQNHLIIESINYDYIPGETESRRAWYITLRSPPSRDLTPGMFVRLDTTHSPNTIIIAGANASVDNCCYRVIDVSGRNVIVEPINLDTLYTRSLYPVNLDKHNPLYLSGEFPIYNNAVYDEYGSPFYPRMGRYLYRQRPLIQLPRETGSIRYPSDLKWMRIY